MGRYCPDEEEAGVPRTVRMSSERGELVNTISGLWSCVRNLMSIDERYLLERDNCYTMGNYLDSLCQQPNF